MNYLIWLDFELEGLRLWLWVCLALRLVVTVRIRVNNAYGQSKIILQFSARVLGL